MINGDTAFFDGKPDGPLTKYIKEMNGANSTLSAIGISMQHHSIISNALVGVKQIENATGLER